MLPSTKATEPPSGETAPPAVLPNVHWFEQFWHDGERDVAGLADWFGTSNEAMLLRVKAMRLL